MKKREFYKQLYALKIENGMAHKEECSEEEKIHQVYKDYGFVYFQFDL